WSRTATAGAWTQRRRHDTDHDPDAARGGGAAGPDRLRPPSRSAWRAGGGGARPAGLAHQASGEHGPIGGTRAAPGGGAATGPPEGRPEGGPDLRRRPWHLRRRSERLSVG